MSEMNNCGRGEQHHNCEDDESEITSSERGDSGEHLVENRVDDTCEMNNCGREGQDDNCGEQHIHYEGNCGDAASEMIGSERGDLTDNCGADNENCVGKYREDASDENNCGRGEQESNCGDDQHKQCGGECGDEARDMTNYEIRKDDHLEGSCGDDEITDCERGAQEGNCGDDQAEQYAGNCDEKSSEICDGYERKERIGVIVQTCPVIELVESGALVTR